MNRQQDRQPDPGPGTVVTPPPEPAATAAAPGFRLLPPGRAAKDPPPPPLPPGGGGDGGSAPGSSAASNRAPTPTPKPFSRDKARAYEAIARGVLRAAGGLLNRYLAGHDPARPPEDDESFIPDDDDDKTIPPPVGRLAARRIPFGDGENLSDVEDIGMAAVGLLAFAAKGLTSLWQHSAERRRSKAPRGTAVHPGPASPDEEPSA